MNKKDLNNVKSSGFKTPDDYFETFDDKLFTRLNEKESIKDVKDTGFKVPKGYFDTVEDNIFKKREGNNKLIISLKQKKTWYYVTGIAASLVLFFGILFNTSSNTEDISAEMVETYLEISDLDSYELAQLLSENDFLEDDFTLTETTYNEDNLETYLLDYSDIETIIEQ